MSEDHEVLPFLAFCISSTICVYAVLSFLPLFVIFPTGPSPWSSRVAVPLPFLVCLYIELISANKLMLFIRQRLKHCNQLASLPAKLLSVPERFAVFLLGSQNGYYCCIVLYTMPFVTNNYKIAFFKMLLHVRVIQ